MEQNSKTYLTTKQLIEKYPFLTRNRLKNLLFRNSGGLREKAVRRLGRNLLIHEEALLQLISDSK
jgi:hypothetical protein